jgi:hypothetical protein
MGVPSKPIGAPRPLDYLDGKKSNSKSSSTMFRNPADWKTHGRATGCCWHHVIRQ